MIKYIDKRKVVTYTTIIIISIVVYMFFNNFTNVKEFLFSAVAVISPIIIGFIFAYVINIPMKFLEENLLHKVKLSKSLKRIVALLLTIVAFVALVVVIFSFAIPQLVDSINILVDNIPGYIKIVQTYSNSILVEYNLSTEITKKIVESWNELLTGLSSIIMSVVESVYGFAGDLFSGIFNALLSFILAIYMLISKEKLTLLLKRVLYAFIPIKVSNRFMKLLAILNKSFENFIRGQIVEAFIIGTICFVGMSIFGFQYALLISVIIGITNMIPMFGPYIGGTPSFLILVMVDPVKAIWFVVFLIVLQQVEGNIIYPRVVGTSMGLSGFWVLIAVIVGNNLFGIVGIIIGIPIFSTIYTIVREFTAERLKEKEIKII
ncbi:AI-2E family transporter [Clostridium grantii]|uniref:Predicted PurR-regulated permease PerM n=1 Tax=Clostridium grantii DSM 8605 TaxID=1121316 RepID=A0A1M5WFB9_9CLOT|nr:AI-2E family transporter [Clostridium grantii]SHH85924.1 Predicted PurR-regulated permease PerM [Clostridium grantii DSM 8605]